jgi:hypothetical protein
VVLLGRRCCWLWSMICDVCLWPVGELLLLLLLLLPA